MAACRLQVQSAGNRCYIINLRPKPKQTIGKFLSNFASLLSGKLSGDFFIFLLFVVISRQYGQEGIGQYSFAIAFTGFFAVFAEFGLYQYSIKELSRNPDEQEYYGGVLSLRLALSCVALLALVIVLLLLPLSFESKMIIFVIGLYQIALKLLGGVMAVFIAHEKMFWSGVLEFSVKASISCVCFILIFLKVALVYTLVVFPVATLVYLGVGFWLVSKKFSRPRWILNKIFAKKTLVNARSFASASLMNIISTRIDVVMLGLFMSTTASGIYNVAYRVIFMLQCIPFYFGATLAPLSSRLYKKNKHELWRLYTRALRSVVLVATPVAAGLFLVAPRLIDIIFGEQYIVSVGVLRILSGVLFMLFFSHVLGVFLIACDCQKLRARGYILAVLISIVCNLIFIPLWSYYGAAMAALCTETVLSVYFIVQLKAVLGRPQIIEYLLVSILSSAVFFVFFFSFPPESLVVVIVGSSMIYLSCILLYRPIRENEFSVLANLFKTILSR